MTATTTSSKKAKGQRLVKEIVQRLNDTLSGYGVTSKCMPLSGMMAGYEADVDMNIPIKIEAKNCENHNVWKEWDQAQAQAVNSEIPVLVMSRNRLKEPLAVITLTDFIYLLEMSIQNGFGAVKVKKGRKRSGKGTNAI